MAPNIFFAVVVLLLQSSVIQAGDCSVPDPIAFYPLNGNYRTREIKNRQLAGKPTGVSLTEGPFGEPNGSYQFRGKSCIRFNNNGNLTVRHSITMLCWVFHSPNARGPLFVYRYNSVGMRIRDNTLIGIFNQKELSTEIPSDQWNFVGASYDNDSGNISLWVNGTLRNQEPFDAGITLNTAFYVIMGKPRSGNHNFVGRITAMQVYNVALTQEQIENAKNAADGGCRMSSTLSQSSLLTTRTSASTTILKTSAVVLSTTALSATSAAPFSTTWSSFPSTLLSTSTAAKTSLKTSTVNLPARSKSLSPQLTTSAAEATTATATLTAAASSIAASVAPCSATSLSLSTILKTASSVTETTIAPTSEKELAKKFIDTLGKIDVRKNNSLQDAVGLFQNITDQYNVMENRRDQPDTNTKKEQRESIFQTVVAFEKFALKYGHNRLTKTAPQINITNSKLSLRIERLFHQNAKEFSLEGPGKQTFIKVPSINFDSNGSVVVAIMYKDLHKLFNSDENENIRRLNTIIVAATMYPKPKQLQQNVVLRFKNLQVTDAKRNCVFFNGLNQRNSDGWSEEGCHLVRSKSSSLQTECSCNHLTHFAVLFDYDDNLEITKTDEKILKILTYVGLALSIMGIILTITSYLLFTDVHQPLSQIRVCLTGSLGAAQIIFLAGINATGNKGACVTVAALMQYFIMAAFCWMLVEGIYLYLLVVQVYNINNKMFVYHTLSWGLPAIMVAVSLSIAAGKEGIQSFVSDDHCWMSSANNLIWMFVAFVVMIEVINLLLLVRVIKEMSTMQSTGETHVQQIRLSIKACVVFVPLLGVTWLFGLLSPLHKSFVYIFTILNSTQGFLIFLLHCMRNSQIRERFKRRVNAIFPAANKEISPKKTSRFDQSDVGVPRIIEVQPPSSCSVIELK